MTKIYQIGKDQIICISQEYEAKICTNQEQVIFLYAEPKYDIIVETKYTIKIMLDSNTECGVFTTKDKDKANEYFQIVLNYLKVDNHLVD